MAKQVYEVAVVRNGWEWHYRGERLADAIQEARLREGDLFWFTRYRRGAQFQGQMTGAGTYRVRRL